MSFDWNNFLDFAKSLKCYDKLNIDETACRVSISRAYYAVYGLSCNYLCYTEKDQKLEWAIKLNNPQTRDELLDEHKSFHAYVAKQFDESNYVYDTEEMKEKKLELADSLKLLKRRRKKADYDDTIHNLKKETEASLDAADDIIKLLDYLNNEHAKI